MGIVHCDDLYCRGLADGVQAELGTVHFTHEVPTLLGERDADAHIEQIREKLLSKCVGAMDDEVVVLLYSEFGRRPAENANQGTDHGTANLMMLAGKPIRGGHYGIPMDLSALGPEDNPAYSVDFRRVYASLIDGWLGSSSQAVLGEGFSGFDFFRI